MGKRRSTLLSLLRAVIVTLALGTLIAGADRSNESRDEDDGDVGAEERSSSSAATGGLQCPSCEQIHCTPRRPDRLKCRGGVTLGVCRCCPVCARVDGESCGGQWNYLGRCDRGLFCDLLEHQVWHHKTQDGQLMLYHNKRGVCKPVTPDMFNSDQGHATYCQPKCTPDFCMKNPKAICSSIDNAERKRDCQSPCQHTSCSACRFVTPEPDCVKCSTDDFSCMRHYAKCLRKHFCPKNKFPCRKGTTLHQAEQSGTKLLCMVPECLESHPGGNAVSNNKKTSLLPSNRI